MRILIIEDEIDLAEALAALLCKNQYTVDTVHDGLSGYDYAKSLNYDAIILDIMLPRLSGIELLSRLREEKNSTPVMLLTAKGETSDRIKGYDSGADDYLPKPFDTDELLSRLRALLRRGGEYTPDVLEFGDLTMDCAAGILRCGKMQERLSGKEFQVMELFLRSPRVIISAERIMERVWGWDTESEINVVWVHISNLRKKIKAIGSRVLIRASRGLGYLLEEGL